MPAYADDYLQAYALLICCCWQILLKFAIILMLWLQRTM